MSSATQYAEPDGPVSQAMLGALEPAHATAPGKALLAHRDAWQESILAQPLSRHTPRTLTDPRDLAAELAPVRARGHAIDHGEHHEDVHAVAATVFLVDDAVGALAVSLTAAQSVTTGLGALAADLTQVAEALSAALNVPSRDCNDVAANAPRGG